MRGTSGRCVGARRVRAAARLALLAGMGLGGSTRVEASVGRGPAAMAQPPPSRSTAQQLHAEGDAHYAEHRYAEARSVWLQAYARVPDGPDAAAYRTTLLSLITSATLEAYAIEGELERVQEAVELLEGFLAAEPELAPELHAVVADDLRRLRPVVDRGTPRAGPVDTTEPEPPLPSSPPPDAEPSPGAPDRRPAGIALLSVGVASTLAGLAAIAAGSQFRPRAQAQLDAVDDPQARERAFLDDEVGKGRAWMGSGAGVATVGVALTIAGAVVLARSRRRGSRAPSVAMTASGRGWFLGTGGRF